MNVRDLENKLDKRKLLRNSLNFGSSKFSKIGSRNSY